MTYQNERAQSVRLQDDKILQPLQGKEEASGEEDTEEATGNEEVVLNGEWQQVSNKVEELAEKVAIHFEDAN